MLLVRIFPTLSSEGTLSTSDSESDRRQVSGVANRSSFLRHSSNHVFTLNTIRSHSCQKYIIIIVKDAAMRLPLDSFWRDDNFHIHLGFGERGRLQATSPYRSGCNGWTTNICRRVPVWTVFSWLSYIRHMSHIKPWLCGSTWIENSNFWRFLLIKTSGSSDSILTSDSKPFVSQQIGQAM